MNTQKQVGILKIDEQLPSLNDFISKMNSNKYIGNKFKRDIQDEINTYIMISKMKPITCRVDLEIHWYEKSKRRDSDNVFSSTKFCLDSLQEMNIIENDSQRYVRNIFNYLEHDKTDHVVILFLEVEE